MAQLNPGGRSLYALIVVLVLLLAGCRANSGQTTAKFAHPPAIIYLVRHAEKLTDGQMDLSPAGEDRARLLRQAFSPDGHRSDLPTPQILFAAHISAHSNRSMQTLLPLAEALHLPIDDSFRNDDFQSLAAALLSGEYAGKIVLVAWHHGKIPQLAEALGAKPPYNPWPQEEYDRIWRIDYTDGKANIQDMPYPRPADSR